MWEEEQLRRHHHHHDEKKANKPIRNTFFVFHIISILFGIGLIVVAHLAQVEERNTMGRIQLRVTQATATIYNICGGAFFLAVLIGLCAQFFRKSFLFLLYCVLLTIICLAQFSASGTAFGNMSAHGPVIQSLKELMMDYGNKNKKDTTEMTLAWDSLQQKYRCCGVNSYMDWQTVDFGLTSLRVPPSCCLKERWTHVKQVPKNCGQNMLPDHKRANESIFVNGCMYEIMKKLDGQLFILGVVGVIIAFFIVLTIVFSCFLVITKRV